MRKAKMRSKCSHIQCTASTMCVSLPMDRVANRGADLLLGLHVPSAFD